MRISHFQEQNGPIVSNKKFFGKNHYYYFHLPIGPIHCEKFLQQIQSYEDVPNFLHAYLHAKNQSQILIY